MVCLNSLYRSSWVSYDGSIAIAKHSEGDRSVNLVVSDSISYILDTSLPSVSSWGSTPDSSLLDARPFPPVTTNPGTRLLAGTVPSRKNWSSKQSATPPTTSREFGSLATSETALSLMLAATPPGPLPIMSSVSTSTSGSLSDAPSQSLLSRYPVPEDCPMPILDRVSKRRSSPPYTSQPYSPKGKPTRR